MTLPNYSSSTLADYVEECVLLSDQLSEERKGILDNISESIKQRLSKTGKERLIFICTHNSRRSHFAQVWAQIAAYHYKLNIQCYSGGTEATALYAQTLNALTRSGILSSPLSQGDNPVYALRFSDRELPVVAFSKVVDHPFNVQADFGALMTCDHAQANCPFIPEASFRLPLTYTDPKHSDGKPEAEEVYDSTCSEIASEMFYLMNKIADA